MRLVDADAFAMYLQLVCKGNDMSAEKKVFSANGIIHMLQDMPTASDIKWIPVSEKLPEKSGYYLVICYGWYRAGISEYSKIHGWREEDGYDGLDDRVLAWMPLPEPYEVKDGSD